MLGLLLLAQIATTYPPLVSPEMADLLGCTGSQVVRRNAGDTAFECATVSAGGAPTDAEYIVAEANGSLSAEVAPAGDDQVPTSDSATAVTWRTVPDCDNGTTSKLLYDQATNAWTCGTDQGGGAALVVEEADGTPTVSSVDTIEFDSADGFTVTDETGGDVQVDLVAATAAQAGGVSTSSQTFGGDKTFNNDVSVGEQLVLAGDISPSQITGDQNNYAGCAAASTVCKLNVDATPRDITGITDGVDGRQLQLLNTTSSGFIYLIDELYNTSSTAANRFSFGSRNCLLGPGEMLQLSYDGTASRWRVIGGDSQCGNFHTLGRRHLVSYMGCNTSATGTDDSMFDQTATGTGAAMNVPLATSSGVCYLTLTLGTTTTGRASATTSLTGNFHFSGGYATFLTNVTTGTNLSDGTDDYIYYAGALDSVTAEPADGCFFKYNDTVNSGAWQGVCTNNSTPTTCNTGVTVATSTNYNLSFIVNKGGTSVTFYVNRTSTCTVASNIPITSARAFAFGYAIRKTLGTVSRSWFQGPFFVRTDPSVPVAVF